MKATYETCHITVTTLFNHEGVIGHGAGLGAAGVAQAWGSGTQSTGLHICLARQQNTVSHRPSAPENYHHKLIPFFFF